MEDKLEMAMTGFLCHQSVRNLIESSVNPKKIKLNNISYLGWVFIHNLEPLVKPDLIQIFRNHSEAEKIFAFIAKEYPDWLDKMELKDEVLFKINKLWQIEILIKMGFSKQNIIDNIYYANLDLELTNWIIKTYSENPTMFKKHPLLSAVRFNCLSSIEFMLKAGLSVKVKDLSTGMTLLHYACAYPPENGLYLSTMLLDHGIDINAKDISGHTALYYLSIGLIVPNSSLKLYWIKRMLSYRPDFNIDTVIAITKSNVNC